MSPDLDPEEVAAAIQVSVGLFFRKSRQTKDDSGLSIPERVALSRLERVGPSTPTELARQEQITPQAMGSTLAGLEVRGLIVRHPDPTDGRRAVMSITDEGRQALQMRRSARTAQLADLLRSEFTPEEVSQLMTATPLIERLAEAL